MTLPDPPDPIRLPVYHIVPGSPGQEEGLLQETERVLALSLELPPGSYALEIQDTGLEPLLKRGSLAVFSTAGSGAIEQVFLVKRRGKGVCLGRLIRDDRTALGDGSAVSRETWVGRSPLGRRKSYMTPTPLHIPGSRVSPIPDSSHSTVLLKSLRSGGSTSLCPADSIEWMHPLVFIKESE